MTASGGLARSTRAAISYDEAGLAAAPVAGELVARTFVVVVFAGGHDVQAIVEHTRRSPDYVAGLSPRELRQRSVTVHAD